jgi:two-component system LytT family response regulator
MFSWLSRLCNLHSLTLDFELLKVSQFAILQFIWDQPREKIVGVALPETYTCVIIDDNELDRLTVTAFAKKIPYLQISGIFDSAVEAEKFLAGNPIDIFLSDIDMPGLNGTELRKKMMNIPVCIFITLYPDYAPEGFELSALDFLLKPISFDRFEKAVERARAYLDIKHKADLLDFSLGADTIYIKDGLKHIKLSVPQIVYLEALKDYTLIATTDNQYKVLSSISNLLKEDSFRSFIRIHRSFAVQRNYIANISAQTITAGDYTLPIGRNFKSNLDGVVSR